MKVTLQVQDSSFLKLYAGLAQLVVFQRHPAEMQGITKWLRQNRATHLITLTVQWWLDEKTMWREFSSYWLYFTIHNGIGMSSALMLYFRQFRVSVEYLVAFGGVNFGVLTLLLISTFRKDIFRAEKQKERSTSLLIKNDATLRSLCSHRRKCFISSII